MAGVINRDAFAAPIARDLVWVDTPTWTGEGTGVYVRGLTVRERVEFSDLTQQADKSPAMAGLEAGLFLVLTCVVDDDGKPLLTEESLGAFGEKDADVINVLGKKILEVSGMSREAIAAAEEAGLSLEGDGAPKGKGTRPRKSGGTGTG